MSVYSFDDFELDVELYQLTRSGTAIRIGPKAFDLLAYLIRNPQRTISKDELVREVWHAEVASDSSVPTCITAVRRALGDDPEDPKFIETVRGRGYRFIGEANSAHTSAFDPGGTGTPSPNSAAFVGRESEMESLRAGLERALKGNPQVFLLLGEAGLGKTRLAEEFAQQSGETGALALLGRCREDTGAPAFWPWVQILRSYIELDSEAAFRHLEPHAAVILQMLPELTQHFPDLTPLPNVEAEQARFRLLDAMTLFFQAAAKTKPLVLVIDDLHRADAASLLLLEFLVRELRGTSVLVLGTYRDLEVRGDTAREQCLARVAGSGLTRSIQLKGLSRRAVSELVGQPEDTDLVEALYEQSAGNPFFLTQLVQVLGLESAQTFEKSARRWEFELPTGVRDAIASQLAGLPEKTRDALAVASAVGRDFSIAVLARAMNNSVAELLEWLEPATTARLLEANRDHPGNYRFLHMLLRDVVYDQIGAYERQKFHKRIGEALEALHAPAFDSCIEDLAFHFAESAGNSDIEKAIEYCLRAGEHAASRLAHDNVPQHFRRALELMDLQHPIGDPRKRCELLIRLGSAQMKVGARDLAKTSLRRAASIAREVGAPKLLAEVALNFSPGFFTIETGVSDSELAALLVEAKASLPQSHLQLQTQLTARLALDAVWSNAPERCDVLSREALNYSHNLSNPVIRAQALSARHEALWGAETFDERRKLISEIGELARIAADAEISLMYRVLNITALLEAGEIREVDREIIAHARLVEDSKLPHAQWYVSLYRSMRALMEGRYEAAASAASRFLELGNRFEDNNAPQAFGAQLIQRRWEQGRLEDLVGSVADFVSENPTVLGWRAGLAFIRSELKHLEAIRDLEFFSESRFEDLPKNGTWSITIALLSNTCVNLHNAQQAERLYEILIPAKMRFTVVGYGVMLWGSCARELGNLASLMGRFDEAEENFEVALSQNTKIAAVPWIARSQYDYAQMLIRRGRPKDKQRARELATAAHQTAHQLPIEKLELETAELVRQIGGSP